MARELVAAGDCKGAYARNKYGDKIYRSGPDACSWCTLGALYHVNDLELSDVYKCFNYISGICSEDHIVKLHDSRTHLQNVECIERAILLALKDEANGQT